MTILVTGATGAIGIPLTEHLVETHQVTALVRDPNSRAARHLKDKGARLLRASLPDQLPAPSLFKRFEVVIHLAADISFSLTGKTIKEVNVEGTKVLLTRLRPDTHLIFTSTALVHGPSDTPISEDATANPLDSYTRSKWEAEEEIRKAHRKTGQRYTILRPAFVVTPIPSGLRQKFLKLASLPLVPLPGGGTNLLPFLSYKDLLLAIDLVVKNGPINNTLLLTHHTSRPLRSMLELPDGQRPSIIALPRWTASPLPAYIRALLTKNWIFASRRAVRTLGWRPQFDPFTHERESRKPLGVAKNDKRNRSNTILKRIRRPAEKILRGVGTVQTALLLGLFYYLILAPFAILYQFSRIFRKTPSHPTSYWIKRPTEIPTQEKLMQQY